MQGKATLVAEDVQSFALGVTRGRSVVLALIEEGAGLLSLQRLVVKAHPVHGEDGAGLFALNQA